MELLELDAAELIASPLLDERDLSSLRASCRFWRQVYQSNALWGTLIKQRFGREFQPEDPGLAEAAFRRLAKLQKPVRDGSVIWLNGDYLAVDTAAGSLSEEVVRLNSVCWLDISTAIPGALPGTYTARCRLKFLPHWHSDELHITATPTEGCGEPKHRLYTWQQLRDAVGPAGAWVELSTSPFVMSHKGSVEVRVHAHSGSWKRGILFDTMRLVRQQGPEERRRAQRMWQQEAQQSATGPGGAQAVTPSSIALDAVRGTLERACSMQ